LNIDVENMSPAEIVSKINTITGVNESLLRRVTILEELVGQLHKT
jgi:hypothetical protein